MNKRENKLFSQQVIRMLQNIQESNGQKELFLNLVIEAKERAYHDLLEHSMEFRLAQEREHKLDEQLEEIAGKSFSSEYTEAVSITDTIWAEEMYLRGIQDAVTILTLANKTCIFDVTGISLL